MDRTPIINAFMDKVRHKQTGLTKGIGGELENAVSLIEVCVAFEAYITANWLQEAQVARRIERFSTQHDALYKRHYLAFKFLVEPLKVSLDSHALLKEPVNYADMDRVEREALKIEDPQDLGQIIKVIYRVRSNLIHGSKTPYDDRNPFLIKTSLDILFRLMDLVLLEVRDAEVKKYANQS